MMLGMCCRLLKHVLEFFGGHEAQSAVQQRGTPKSSHVNVAWLIPAVQDQHCLTVNLTAVQLQVHG
jgi:hypothetical protein